MSQSDSFIDEVTEEVRRERLFGLARRYGWIAILAVVLIIGAAGVVEWRKAQARAEAEDLGDALLAAMASENALARATALDGVGGTGLPGLPARFLAADSLAQSDVNAAGALLDEIAADSALPAIYRDLASLKLTMLADYPMLSDEKLVRLETLIAPGAPFRMAALEQIAAVRISRNEPSQAIDILRTILTDADASAGQQQRAQQLIVALGGEFEDS
ncbi:hypothetical protein [Pseudoruegeria sp. SK021]|uniref:hypothetical protein n=1 Tax=Pseudoruegeria sp. SK021 TaxID=1933035 RepID=UPI000A21EEB0|nr:hypothetical protein [Pseudoruegeria sp. SK021]OSP56284.1 hypothetical protein BV911_03060 [Pseudoruegeria sp. SK021]